MANIEKIQESLDIEIPAEIFDEDGNLIPNDGDKINQGLRIISDVRMDLCRISRQVSDFFDQELYRYLGVSKTEAAEKFFGMSIRHIQNIQLIHSRLGSAYEELEFLGTGKLKAISQLPEEQRDELIREGVLILQDGSEITVDEIAGAKTKEVEKTLKSQRLQISRLKNENDEIQKEAQAEVKQLKDEITHLNSMVDIPAEERGFHKKISKTRETQNHILSIQTNFHAGFTQLAQIELTEENAICSADIEALLTNLARQVLNFESHFGLSLGNIKKELTA